MLHYLSLEISSITASFRNPEFQNFHKSFNLPPPTTLIGMAGAAMGLDPLQAQTFFDENVIFSGVSGKAKGKSNDLWKYNDFKNGSIILRELLFYNSFQIVFASDTSENIDRLVDAFKYPVYALSLGPNDSLLKIGKNIESGTAEWKKIKKFSYSLIEGDILSEAFQEAASQTEFKFTLDFRQAIIESLPIRFEYESNYGIRRVSKKKVFSFVQNSIELSNSERNGIQIGDKLIHLFQL